MESDKRKKVCGRAEHGYISVRVDDKLRDSIIKDCGKMQWEAGEVITLAEMCENIIRKHYVSKPVSPKIELTDEDLPALPEVKA